MFTYTDHQADDERLTALSADTVAATARETLTFSRQAEARNVILAYRIGETIYHDMIADPTRQRNVSAKVRDLPEKAAIGEISLQLKVSRTQAGNWAELGSYLIDMPTLRIAYLSGKHSFHRIRMIAYTAALVDERIREELIEIGLELAARHTADKTLRAQLAEILIALDPDAAATARRDYADRNQHVRIQPDEHGHATIDATVPAEDGVFLDKKLNALIAARICANDPRPHGCHRTAALAEIIGMPHKTLTCQCGNTRCPAPDGTPTNPAITHTEPADPEPVKNPDVEVVTDPAGDRVPDLTGHGPIDPEHAEEIITGGVATQLDLPGLELPPGVDLPPGYSGLILTDSQSTNAPIIDPTGHGGHLTPPKGALTYKPSKALQHKIGSLDRTCRYPGCGRPSTECQLDHLVKFNPHDPINGGWTVEYNLIPLCRPDHHRKHLGYWIPQIHTDRTITWHNPETGDYIKTHPR